MTFGYTRGLGWIQANTQAWTKSATLPEAGQFLEAVRTETLSQILEQLTGGGSPAPLLRNALNGWLGYVDGSLLDWTQHDDLSREQVHGLIVAAFGAARRPAGGSDPEARSRLTRSADTTQSLRIDRRLVKRLTARVLSANPQPSPAGPTRSQPGTPWPSRPKLARVIFAVFLGLFATVLFPAEGLASTTLDIRGMYVGTSQASGNDYSIGSVIDTENCAAGTFSGHGVKNNQTYSNFTGTISGDPSSNQITTHEVYTGVTYTADGVSSASLDSMGRLRLQGTFSDSYGQSGTADSTRVSGPPNDGGCGGQTTTTTTSTSTSTTTASTTSTSSTSTSAGHSSATSVQCDYDTFMQSFSCTAQVADASGNQPPHTPTGFVAFVLDPGADGSFPQGSTCSLQPSTSGPTAYCSVTYVPGQQGVPAGTQPRLSATYSGDSTLASSSGRPTNRYAPIVPGPTSTTSTTTSSSATSTTSATSPTPLPPAPKPKFCALRSHVQRAAAARFGVLGRLRRSPPGLAVVVAGGHAPKGARTLSRGRANHRALALLRPARGDLSQGVAVYGLPKPLRAGSVVTEARLGLGRSLLPALRLRERAWLYWEDLAPLRRFTHTSVVLVIAAKGGRVLARATFMTYPEINGRVARFMTSRSARAIYQRGPHRRHRIRLSLAALARLRSAVGTGRRAHVADQVTNVLAHTSDVSKSALITLTGRPNNGETFKNEERAITGVFASHGIATQSTQDAAGLAAAVNDAEAAGRTSVTIFIDAHGANSSQSAQPTVLIGYQRTPDGFLPDPLPAQPPVLRASDLTAIAQAHPDIKFSFIIDACYSGRFVDPLSVQPNVASVTTSSNAQQRSMDPVELASPEFVAQHGYYTQATVVLPSGKTLAVIGGTDSGLSPFTTGEVAALKQGFLGKGSDPDVTSVVQDARTLEPTYDLAAVAGVTNPSPEPFSAGAGCEDPPGTPDPSPPDDWFIGA